MKPDELPDGISEVLLELDFLEHSSGGFGNSEWDVFSLTGTPYELRLYYGPATFNATWSKKIASDLREKVFFEEVFNNSPEQVKGNLIYHMDLLDIG